MNLQSDLSMQNEDLNYRTMVEKDLNEKLKILRENQERIARNEREYFDEEKNQQDINQYYQGIKFHNSNGKELFKSLHNLFKTTHHKQFSYNQSGHHLETWVDLHPDGKYKSLYSGKQADPEMVIQSELENPAISNIVPGENGELLNIEHVVPQSWFSKKEPMRGDMHHLFYCEKDCNSFRGNKQYRDFPEYNPEAIRVNKEIEECGMGKSNSNEFEPEYGKGMVARASLYFLLRYPDKISIEHERETDIPLLLKWHTEFPPDSKYEKHRNQAIFELQGNRNPFIDFPEFGSEIDFSVIYLTH
ncbi:endonuclease [Peribacillus sp. NJ4]|uniref:endonuclease I family protein n=1 Tax=Peribacillus sp. NJ4 TaxID=3055862 RepID=UPI0025A1E6E2|nr:endonuclease [Peribacillus sp. NJ4]MDM5214961.1 endonuclease [Peribacillus sp. NJ4]